MPAAVAVTAEATPPGALVPGTAGKSHVYEALLKKTELWSERRHKVPAGPRERQADKALRES